MPHDDPSPGEQEIASQLLEAVGQGIAVIGTDGRVRYANAALARMLGYAEAAALVGRPAVQLTAAGEPPVPEPGWERFPEAASGGRERRLRRADGGEFHAFVTGIPLRAPDGDAVTALALTVSNVTERRRIEGALRESEERFRRLAAATLEGVVLHERGRVVDANTSAARLFGLAPGELIGRAVLDLAAPESRGVVREMLRESRLEASYEIVGLRTDGSCFPVELHASTIYASGRELRVTVLRDLTERKRAEAALVESEERFRQLVESASDIIYRADVRGRFTYVNPIASRVTGYAEDELLGRRYLDLIHPDWREAVRGFYARQIEQGISTTYFEFPLLTRSGDEVWIGQNVQLLHEDGRFVGVQAVARDVTERVSAEAALRESEERLQDLFDSASDLIQIVTAEGGFQFVNRAWRDTLGYGPDELRALSLWDVLDPAERRHCRREFARLAAGEAVEMMRTIFVSRTGARIAVEGRVSARHEGGQMVSVRGIFRDVTERLRIERMKDEFISVISHELRTPLTSLRGSLGLLASGRLEEDPERGRRMTQLAVQNTDRLIRLLNDVLDIERLQAGKTLLERRPLRAAEIFRAAREAVQGMADAASVAIDTTAEGADIELYADADRMTQVVVNLLSNAVKFSAPGQRVVLGAAAHAAGAVEFWVHDSGRGIPAEKLESIFERFQQVDASDARQKGGTGLGLAISREIVTLHGGRIWAESAPGAGTTFRVVLPAPVNGGTAAPAP